MASDEPPPGANDLGIRHRNVLYAVAAFGAIALVSVIVIGHVRGGRNAAEAKAHQLATLMHAAGCSYRNVTAYLPLGQPLHRKSLTAKFPWNTSPPSNGQHYPEWAVWGFYTTAVNPRKVVHNEEHGGVVLWWGPKVSHAVVQALHRFYLEQPIGGFGTPYASLGARIAITAWTATTSPLRYGLNGDYGEGHIAVCPAFTPATERAFTAFRALYRGHSPQGVPLSADKPGMGPS